MAYLYLSIAPIPPNALRKVTPSSVSMLILSTVVPYSSASSSRYSL